MLTRILIFAVILSNLVTIAAKEPETIEQLEARAQSADKKKQPELYVELSRRQVEAANEAYNTNAEQARATLEQGIKSGEKAADTSIETGKHLKKVEIELRKITTRLVNMQRSWAFEDQHAVQSAVDRMDAARTKILQRMFGK
jgi:hypothetical protein